MILEALWEMEQRRAAPVKEKHMNDQVAAQIRQFLQIMGTLLTTVGIIKPGIADTWIPIIMQVIGPVMMLASIGWSYQANKKESIILSTTKMPEVDSKKLAAAIDDPALKEIAKAGVSS